MTLAFAPERIEQWPLARLQPYAKNAKLHGADHGARIAASMAKFGCTAPSLVAEGRHLIAGDSASRFGVKVSPAPFQIFCSGLCCSAAMNMRRTFVE
jgi:hypothetical protein